MRPVSFGLSVPEGWTVVLRSWHQLRLLTDGAVAVAGVVLGLWWVWPIAWIVALLAALSAVDARWWLQREEGSVLRSFSLDATLIGLAIMAVDLPAWALGAPLASLIVIAFTLLPGAAAVIGGTYAAGVVTAAILIPLDVSPPARPLGGPVVVGVIAGLVFLAQIAAFTGLVASTLRASLDRLRALVRAKDEFVASVAHQLRTPLTGVFGLAEELRSEALLLDEQETRELLGLVADQASEAAHVMDNLAVAARLEIDLVTVRPKPVVVEHVLQRVLQRLTDPPTVHGADVTVLADPDRLAQILRNLLSNALHHGARPVSIHAESDANGVEIRVVDSGPGVSDPDRLFQPYQPALYETGQPLALGIGLWVSHQLAALMEGELQYCRQEDSTTFALRLPQPT